MVRAMAAKLPERGVNDTLLRDKKNDYASVVGADCVRAHIRQILGTKRGEIPWRPTFGSRLHLLLHAMNNPAASSIAAYYVLEALALWEPRVVVSDVQAGADIGSETLRVVIHYSTSGAAASVEVQVS